MIRMPGKIVSTAAVLSPEDGILRAELVADVQKLAGDIGERNIPHYPALQAAAEFIEKSLADAGLQPRRDSYDVRGRTCHNIEAEIRGNSSQIVVVGAHYDSVFGAPGANDNGSGVAALLALARRFAQKTGGPDVALRCFRQRRAALFSNPRDGKFRLCQPLQGSRRSNFRHDQPRNDRLFF